MPQGAGSFCTWRGASSSDDQSVRPCRHTPQAVSLGGTQPRPTSTAPRSDSPGPGAYDAPRSPSPSQGRRAQGWSFGVREKTVSPQSTVGVRCHGPLASKEAQGLQVRRVGLRYQLNTLHGLWYQSNTLCRLWYN